MKFRSEEELLASRSKPRTRLDGLEAALSVFSQLAKRWYPQANHDNTAEHMKCIRESIKRVQSKDCDDTPTRTRR